jgi:hypothetical protein
MVGDAAENIAEPGKRIDLYQSAACDEAAQKRRCLAAAIATEEGPVVPSDREATQRPLGTVVVDGEIAIAAVTNHCLKAVALVTGCKLCSGQRPAK